LPLEADCWYETVRAVASARNTETLAKMLLRMSSPTGSGSSYQSAAMITVKRPCMKVMKIFSMIGVRNAGSRLPKRTMRTTPT